MDSLKLKVIAVVLSLAVHLSFLLGNEKAENFSTNEVVTQNSGRVVFNIPQKKKPVMEKPKPKPKKITKKPKKKKPEPKKVEKPVKKTQEIIEERIVQNTSTSNNQPLTKNEIAAKKNVFFSKIKELINKNKSYPKTARRRGIMGSVLVKFTLNNNGELSGFEILGGKKVFFKSAKLAIEKSFPLKIPKELSRETFEFELTISYSLT